ncbi:hypothetical protein BC940DRAFT_152785 [Gongronella butleri]|nr:hypothetical protein BC940DRAFT_152785 [Gongronella butleri]
MVRKGTRLRREPSVLSNHSGEETWKIAKRPTVTTSPLTALSRSVSIESHSPITPIENQQPFLAFRVAATTDHREHTLSFFKTDTSSSLFKPQALAYYKNHWLQYKRKAKQHQKPNCHRCHRPVRADQLVAVNDQFVGSPSSLFEKKRELNLIHPRSPFFLLFCKTYHQNCFSCHLCRVPLKPRKEVRESNGIVYCSKHFDLIRSRPDCATCHAPIDTTERLTKAFGVYFHREHLTCCQCQRPVDEFTTGVVRHKHRIYCRPHFNELYLPKCRGCGKAVEKESISSSDGKLEGRWHKRCFTCKTCDQPFDDTTFYVFNNEPYCKQHYHQLNKSLCHVCQSPIEGRCAKTSDGHKFHPHCFLCHDCQQPIKDIYYTDHRDHIYCPSHSIDLHTDRRTTTFLDI